MAIRRLSDNFLYWLAQIRPQEMKFVTISLSFFKVLAKEATPIIIVITDSYTHQGPGGSNPYTGLTPTPHTYGQTIEALESIGAHVLGVNTGSYMKVIPDLVQLTIDTEGVDMNGSPVVVNLSSGADSGQTVVDLISSFCFVEL